MLVEAIVDRSGLKYCMVRMRTRLIDSIAQQVEALIENPEEQAVQKEAAQSLIAEIEQRGLEYTVEEVAVLWFIRLITIRFMEINGYLPDGIRLLSISEASKNIPDCIRDVYKLPLELDFSIVADYLQNGNEEKLYRHILIRQCRNLAELLPDIFEPLPAYAEFLAPSPLLGKKSVFFHDLVETIPEIEWHDVEIIGWLYQYFINPRHEEVVGINRGIVDKVDIPVATQLFTPRWIAQYLIQNTLGRRWIETGGDPSVCARWEYYLEPAEVSAATHKSICPEKLTVLDPCVGSGHILIYAFDLLYTIYLASGYEKEIIPYLILEKNLFGLDIDKNVIQLARFALIMKARQYCADIFNCPPKVNVYVILESPPEDCWQSQLDSIEAFFPPSIYSKDSKKQLADLLILFQDASNLGSLIQVNGLDLSRLSMIVTAACKQILAKNLVISHSQKNLLNLLSTLLRQAQILQTKYEIVVTNPPYMGPKAMNNNLKQYLQHNYKQYTQDIFAAFIKRNCLLTCSDGLVGFMTPFVWMFIKTFSQLRQYILTQKSLQSLIQLEYGGYEDAVVPICTFVLRNKPSLLPGVFLKLSEFKGAAMQPVKVREACRNPEVSYRYERHTGDFLEIPGHPIAFWITAAYHKAFQQGIPLKALATPKQGLATADNARFLRLWHEVSFKTIAFDCSSRQAAKLSGGKWFPYNKGGEFRKWYGNNDYVINWENDGAELRQFQPAVLRNQAYYFRPAITWSFVSSAKFGARYSPPGFLFDVGGSSVFIESIEDRLFFLALLCSKVTIDFLAILNPTINFQVGNIAVLPVIEPNSQEKEDVCRLASECIDLARQDWNSAETSWDFQVHPFLVHHQGTGIMADAWTVWEQDRRIRLERMQYCEEQINRVFIHLYGLEKELNPIVAEENITLNRPDHSRDVRSFLSFAVGCMFGRYSLDEEGLVYAGGLFNLARYQTFPVVQDNIIPIITDDELPGDIVSRLVEFVQICFGKDKLESNFAYIAHALGQQKGEPPHKTIQRYFLTEFFQDHLQLYKKRPIYWLFNAGPNNSFKALIYLHRYKPDLVHTMQTKYLTHRLQAYERKRYYLEAAMLSQQVPSQIRKEKRKLKLLSKQIAECSAYNLILSSVARQSIHLNLDDGVVSNYAKFQSIQISNYQEDGLLHPL